MPTRAADYDGGVEAGVIEDGGGHRGGGGLAVAAGDGDTVFQPHQLGQQFAARDHGDLQAPRFQDLGILFIDGGADHQRPRAGDVGGGVPFEDARAQPGQPLGDWRELHIGTADGIAEVQQYLGDAAHADSPDPREMQMLLRKNIYLLYCFGLRVPCQSKIVAFDAQPPPLKSPRRVGRRPVWRIDAPRRHFFQPGRAGGELRYGLEKLLAGQIGIANQASAPPRCMASALRVW